MIRLIEKKTSKSHSSFYFCGMISKIAIAGGGTMGSGIALASAKAGYDTILYDSFLPVIDKAKGSINNNLQFLLDKKKISEDEKADIWNRITFTNDVKDCVAGLIIEAIIESPEAKASLFSQLSEVNDDDCIFASNTSSLSITLLQKGVKNPERVAGMHFFNPAHVMKLVEVVQGEYTSSAVTDLLMEVCRKMDKQPVLCKDAPGFIVNRVARHYYLEAMKLVELGHAKFEDVDQIMESSGFKMGPFKLMDMIGMDINLAVSQSLFEAMNNNPRLEPSPLQMEKVKNGDLGRKSGKGFYNYN